VIVLDIETDRKASQIWCVCACDENGKHIVWTTSEGLQQYVNDNAPVIMHNGIGLMHQCYAGCGVLCLSLRR
jgi:hypothetical protein